MNMTNIKYNFSYIYNPRSVRYWTISLCDYSGSF